MHTVASQTQILGCNKEVGGEPSDTSLFLICVNLSSSVVILLLCLIICEILKLEELNYLRTLNPDFAQSLHTKSFLRSSR